jgi:hypothetical protein
MNKQFEVVIRDVQGLWQVVVDKRPTLRGAMGAADDWHSRIVRAGRLGKEQVIIQEEGEDEN